MEDRLPIPFAQIVDTLTEGVLVNTPEGDILYANEGMGRILGCSPTTIVGQHLFDFMDETSKAISRRKLAERAQGLEDRYDFRWRRADGQPVWTQVAVRPAFDAQGQHLGSLLAVSDIRAHKALQEELLNARRDLEARVMQRTSQLEDAVASLQREVQVRAAAEKRANAANAAKTRFLANMSHELRTPLNAIIGYAELALEMPDVPVAEVSDDLHRIERSGRHLLALIDDLLDLARVEQDSLELTLASFDPTELFEELVDWVRPEFRRNRNQLEVDLSLPPAAYGDARRVRQIVLNLLNNANKFCHDGTVELRATHTQDMLVVQVQDEGPGIAPDEHERIFRPFERDTTAVEGTGLGLAISRRYARRMGGELSVESYVDCGATFTLTLPRTSAP